MEYMFGECVFGSNLLLYTNNRKKNETIVIGGLKGSFF